MSKESWNEFAAYYLPKVEACLQDYLSKLAAYPRLKEAMMYSVNAGGKRIRPLLVLAVIKTLNGQLNQASLQVAASLELIHTYSLIHDDLPEMDNDDLRRGKPTNHKVFGQALAVLAGDGLLTTAFELLGQVKLPAETVVQLLNYLAYAAGPQGMVNGQVGDIEGEKT
ncbi:polyprenyl synthetase family protein, partial [Ligilactobacillus agilis]